MNRFGVMCAALVLAGAGMAMADEPTTAEKDSGGLSLDAGLTIPTAYVFRGYVVKDDHALFQPEATVGYGIKAGDVTIKPYLTAWANLTDAPAPGNPEWFNELDLYFGVDFELPHGFTLGLVYDYYNSPANVFDDVHEIGITLSHDDIVNPKIGVYREVIHQNGRQNTYVELGATPGFDMPKLEKLRVDFPLVLGLTPDKYYTKDNGDASFFGYCSASITGTYALSDNWSVLVGVDYVQLLADSARASNNGDDHQWVGRIGVKYSL